MSGRAKNSVQHCSKLIPELQTVPVVRQQNKDAEQDESLRRRRLDPAVPHDKWGYGF